MLFGVIKYCIDTVYDADNVYKMSDFSEEEIEEFINEMNIETFKKIQQFFETMPRLHYEVKYQTKEANEERTVVLKTLTDFFTFR